MWRARVQVAAERHARDVRQPEHGRRVAQELVPDLRHGPVRVRRAPDARGRDYTDARDREYTDADAGESGSPARQRGGVRNVAPAERGARGHELRALPGAGELRGHRARQEHRDVALHAGVGGAGRVHVRDMRRRSDEFRVDALLGWNEYSDVAFCMGIERCCGKLYVTFSQHDERMVLFSIDDPVEFLSGALREI